MRIQRQASQKAELLRSLNENESTKESSEAGGSRATQRPASAASNLSQRPGSAISISSQKDTQGSAITVSSKKKRHGSTICQKKDSFGSPPRNERSRHSFLVGNPINTLRRISRACYGRKAKDATSTDVAVEVSSDASSAKKKGGRQINPKDYVLAERERVNEIKELIDAEDYEAALTNLMSDTDEDMHYFNKVKSETLGKRHDDAFARKHGKLYERPAPVEEPSTCCIWMGKNDFGHSLRCHNKCLFPALRKNGRPLDYCVYHVRYCVNTENHVVPMKVRLPNDVGLCNECYVLRFGHPPKALSRVPGTRRVGNPEARKSGKLNASIVPSSRLGADNT